MRRFLCAHGGAMRCDYELYFDEDKEEEVCCQEDAVYAVYAGTDSVPELVLCQYHMPVIHDVRKERGQ